MSNIWREFRLSILTHKLWENWHYIYTNIKGDLSQNLELDLKFSSPKLGYFDIKYNLTDSRWWGTFIWIIQGMWDVGILGRAAQ